MNEKLSHTVFKAEDQIYVASKIDRIKGTISGYRLFPEYEKPNPYLTFKTADCNIKEIQ